MLPTHRMPSPAHTMPSRRRALPSYLQLMYTCTESAGPQDIDAYTFLNDKVFVLYKADATFHEIIPFREHIFSMDDPYFYGNYRGSNKKAPLGAMLFGDDAKIRDSIARMSASVVSRILRNFLPPHFGRRDWGRPRTFDPQLWGEGAAPSIAYCNLLNPSNHVFVTSDQDMSYTLGAVLGAGLSCVTFGAGDIALARKLLAPVSFVDTKISWHGYTDEYLAFVSAGLERSVVPCTQSRSDANHMFYPIFMGQVLNDSPRKLHPYP